MDLYGIIGWPVKHSLSPAMHNAAFKAKGISAEYRLFPLEPEKLEDFLLNRKDVVGFNVTIPHKVRTREILEERTPLHIDTKSSSMQQDLYYVKLSGAINTVKRDKDEIRYFNTDSSGFLSSLKEDLNLDIYGEGNKRSTLIFGCGGAGRAVIAALSWKQSKINKIYVYDKIKGAIDSIKEHFSKQPLDWKSIFENKIEFINDKDISDRIKKCQLLINASPLGMKEGDASIIDRKLLHKDLYVYDLVYNRETQLVKDAKASGCKAVNGLGMLLHQGARAFEFWTGKKAPIDVMKKALLEAL